jgi:glycosyltransferase involved in cell wall biosynthesis
MRFSIAIPHYNRIDYLLESLRRIDEINYDNLEVVVSDDCSSDDSESVLRNFSFTSPKKLKYSRNVHNLGYDGNLRKALNP